MDVQNNRSPLPRYVRLHLIFALSPPPLKVNVICACYILRWNKTPKTMTNNKLHGKSSHLSTFSPKVGKYRPENGHFLRSELPIFSEQHRIHYTTLPFDNQTFPEKIFARKKMSFPYVNFSSLTSFNGKS